MMRRLLRRGSDAEGGFAMISVVLFGVVLLSVTLMTVTQVQQATNHGTGHLQFEREIHLAETGIDQVLARLQQVNTWSTTPTGPPFGSTVAEEKAWATSALLAAPVVDTDGGQYAVVKP